MVFSTTALLVVGMFKKYFIFQMEVSLVILILVISKVVSLERHSRRVFKLRVQFLTKQTILSGWSVKEFYECRGVGHFFRECP